MKNKGNQARQGPHTKKTIAEQQTVPKRSNRVQQRDGTSRLLDVFIVLFLTIVHLSSFLKVSDPNEKLEHWKGGQSDCWF